MDYMQVLKVSMISLQIQFVAQIPQVSEPMLPKTKKTAVPKDNFVSTKGRFKYQLTTSIGSNLYRPPAKCCHSFFLVGGGGGGRIHVIIIHDALGLTL